MAPNFWTADEEQELKALVLAGLTNAEIAKKMGRSASSIRTKKQRVFIDNPETTKLASPAERPQTRRARLRQTAPRVFLRAAVFDLETTSFDTGGIGNHLICCCILSLDADFPDTYAIRFQDNRDDLPALLQTIEALGEFDILIGHNIAAFDLNWLNSRRMHHKLDMLPSWCYYDTYQAAKTMAIKTRSKRLGALADYFGLDGEKTAIYETSHSMIDSPHREDFDTALQDIIYHCEQDVILTRQLFDVMWQNDPTRRIRPTKW